MHKKNLVNLFSGVAIALYSVLTTLLSPIIFFKLSWGLKKNRGIASEILMRFFGILRDIDGFEDYIKSKKRIWIHAVSVGETHAAIPLIRELVLKDDECRILFSNTTYSGFSFFRTYLKKNKSLDEKVVHCFSPIDFFWAPKIFLKRIDPQTAIFIETEIWPNTINLLSKKNIKIVLANARLSKNSLIKFKKLSWISIPTLNKFDLILAQSDNDAKRFLDTGAQVKVCISGNMKFDAFVAKDMVRLGEGWKNYFPKKSFWLALSTRKNEEKEIFKAWKKNKPHNALLIVVPRHPERFDWVVKQAKNMGFFVARRSDFLNTQFSSDVTPNFEVVVGDSMGEITAYASFADLSLVGGSVIDCGGQSPIELCSRGCPVFFGPYMTNFLSISNQLLKTSAGFEIHSYDEWITKGLGLLSNHQEFSNSKKAAIQFTLSNKGASKASAEKIHKLLE